MRLHPPDDGRPITQARLLDIPGAAIYLGRSQRAIEAMVEKGQLPVVRLGKRVQFDVKDLDRLIEESK